MHSNHCRIGSPHGTIHLKLLGSQEGWCYKWNITFHFISRGGVTLRTNQNLTSQPLTFFISIWLPLSCRKLEASRYCSAATGGWRLFKDKCSGVQDPRGNHTPPTWGTGETCLQKAVWLHECTCAQIRLHVKGFVLVVRCWCSSVFAKSACLLLLGESMLPRYYASTKRNSSSAQFTAQNFWKEI